MPRALRLRPQQQGLAEQIVKLARRGEAATQMRDDDGIRATRRPGLVPGRFFFATPNQAVSCAFGVRRWVGDKYLEMSSVYVYPREFDQCVSLLTRKLEEIAIKAGVPDRECTDLESILAEFPPMCRPRAEVMLQGIQVSADGEFPAMSFAASYVLKLAREIWQSSPGRIASGGGFGARGRQRSGDRLA